MHRFRVGSTQVEVEYKELGFKSRPQLENLFGDYRFDEDSGGLSGMRLPSGHIKELALREGVKKIVVGGQEQKIRNSDVLGALDAAGLFHPDIDAYEELVKGLVVHNTWLAQLDPFRAVFGPFAPEEAETEDPTETEAG